MVNIIMYLGSMEKINVYYNYNKYFIMILIQIMVRGIIINILIHCGAAAPGGGGNKTNNTFEWAQNIK